MNKRITNLLELKAEIGALKLKRDRHELVLKEQFSSPSQIFHTLFSLFKSKGSHSTNSLKDFIPSDLVTLLTRIIIPGFLNGILFRKSGFITKALVTFLSQKAAKKVNTEVVTDWFDTAMDWVKDKLVTPKVARNTRPALRDYGIPPDSETY